ncbi:hypothetical protein LCGC14_0365750 [marine sediment metagenome]|uniref:Uncharacterized protein n=1 Tax=marine sediment metagenome TaxID=412755 RepID=A0A0F9WF71_9ZZZZ
MLKTIEALRLENQARVDTTARRDVVRDGLYYNFRYRNDSYKARKAMIHPTLMIAKRGDSMLRLYDDGSHQPTKNQEAAMISKCKGWHQKERILKQLQMPAYRQWLKDNRLKTKDNPYSSWLINVVNSCNSSK